MPVASPIRRREHHVVAISKILKRCCVRPSRFPPSRPEEQYRPSEEGPANQTASELIPEEVSERSYPHKARIHCHICLRRGRCGTGATRRITFPSGIGCGCFIL